MKRLFNSDKPHTDIKHMIPLLILLLCSCSYLIGSLIISNSFGIKENIAMLVLNIIFIYYILCAMAMQLVIIRLINDSKITKKETKHLLSDSDSWSLEEEKV